MNVLLIKPIKIENIGLNERSKIALLLIPVYSCCFSKSNSRLYSENWTKTRKSDEAYHGIHNTTRSMDIRPHRPSFVFGDEITKFNLKTNCVIIPLRQNTSTTETIQRGPPFNHDNLKWQIQFTLYAYTFTLWIQPKCFFVVILYINVHYICV